MTLGVPVPVPAFADQDRAGILHRVAVARHRNEELRHRVRIASATCAELLDGLRQRRARLRDEARVLRELLPHAREQRRPVARPSHRRSASRGRTDWPAGVGDIHVEYASTRDPCLEEELVGVYDSFALSVARRFGNRHERAEDLAQVARLGLLKAIRRFDPALGRPFTVFARATIEGELKRHVRDRTWAMRVPRSLQERYLEVVKGGDDLREMLGRSPTVRELAAHAGLTDEQVLEAMELAGQRQLVSLDTPAGPSDLTLDVGMTDGAFAKIETRELLDQLLRRLSDRERELLRLRFGEELTQAEIAERLGVSQMCVSRHLSRTLGRLRAWAR